MNQGRRRDFSSELDEESDVERPQEDGKPTDFALVEAVAAPGRSRRGGPSPSRTPLVTRLDRTRGLVAEVWTTDSFTTTLGEWLKLPVRYVSELHEIGPATEESATQLGIRPGSPVTCRRGHLEVTDRGERHAVADVRAVVARDSLDLEERLALESRTVALGHLLQRRGVRRHTRAVTPIPDHAGADSHLLKVKSTLIVVGQPVAVVDEIVFDNALTFSRAADSRELDTSSS